jgi:hypothetical protein
MKDDGAPHPVELLRDRRGVYGIGVSELFDFEVVAWSCGVELEPYTFERPPDALILRPDWFPDNRPRGAVLQKIAGGFRRGPFMRSHEERLRQFIHHEALNRSGLPWPPQHLSPGETAEVWWSADKQQRRQRSAHGLAAFGGARFGGLRQGGRRAGEAFEFCDPNRAAREKAPDLRRGSRCMISLMMLP